MTDIVGGLRSRLLHDSLYAFVHTGLGDQGWFDSGRNHRPIRFVPRPARWDEAVELNTMAMAFGPIEMQDMEVGSGLTQDDIAVVFDFFAENDSIGDHVSNDVRDLLRGRLGSGRATFPLQDFRQTTPTKVGYVLVDEVWIERPSAIAEKEFRRHWYQIRCVAQDVYTDDAVDVGVPRVVEV